MRPDDSGRRACAVVPLPQSMLELRFAQAGPWWEGQINAELFEAMLRRPLRRAARWWRSRCGPGTVTKHSPPAPGRRSADPRAQRIVDDVSASRAFRAVAHLARDVPAERSGRMEEHHAIRTPRRDRRGNACSPGRMPSHNCRRSGRDAVETPLARARGLLGRRTGAARSQGELKLRSRAPDGGAL